MRAVPSIAASRLGATFLLALGLLFCSPAPAQSANQAAGFRYHLLADLDVGATPGCSLERGARRWESLDMRWEVLADRGGIRQVTRFLCTAGAWVRQEQVDGGEAVHLQAGVQGGDRLVFRIARSALDSGGDSKLHVYAEDPLSGAFDIAGEDQGWTLAQAALAGSQATPIPVLGAGARSSLIALVLLTAALVLWRSDAARIGMHSRRWLALLACAVLLVPPRPGIADAQEAVQRGKSSATLSRVDPAHDLIGNESAVDLLQVDLHPEADSIRVELSVHNIEAELLPASARALFIGSNLTSSNNLPGMFAALAEQAGKSLQVHAVTINGASLEDHHINGHVLREIATGGYDVVIMQQGPSSLPENQIHLRAWSERMALAIRAAGSRPALLMVWPDVTRTAFFPAVRQSYRAAAIAVDGWMLPAGEAWRAAWRENAVLDLYANDGTNPSPLGSYATAATMFASLYRQSPEGLPASLQVGGNTIRLNASEVALVQRAAWQAHLQHGLTPR